MTRAIFSLGHSNHSWDQFHHLLARFEIDCLIDVRSSPTSRWAHFRRDALCTRLQRVGVAYAYLGDALGGMPSAGPTDYATRARSPAFADGIARVRELAARSTPALLCAEADPLHCHRFLLVARQLDGIPNVTVVHILRDGSLESQLQAEERLLALHKMGGDLLEDRADRLARAYVRQEQRLG